MTSPAKEPAETWLLDAATGGGGVRVAVGALAEVLTAEVELGPGYSGGSPVAELGGAVELTGVVPLATDVGTGYEAAEL